MSEPNNLYVGQVLYREVTSRYGPAEINEYTVDRIAKKYLYLKETDRYPINKETLQYEDKVYSQSSFQLYTSKEEIFKRRERSVLLSKIQSYFSWSVNVTKLTTEQIKQIAEIVNISSE